MGVWEVQCSHAFWLLLWSLHIRTREFVLCLPREVSCSVWGMCRKTSLTMQTLQLSLTHKNSQNRKVCRKLIFFNSFVKCHAEYWSLWYEWFKSPSGIYWKANRFSSEIFFFFGWNLVLVIWILRCLGPSHTQRKQDYGFSSETVAT